MKSGSGLARIEQEIQLTPGLFGELWPLTQERRIQKIRYDIPSGDLIIELDEFEGDLSGLQIAEVEFGSEDIARSFRPPPWFDREVTDDPTFTNRSLAMRRS